MALLELAVLLGAERPVRTIRLVSFGAEEQLSVGSAAYAVAHRKEMPGIGVVFNLDSGMRWQHHSAQDNLENVAVSEVVRVVSALANVTRTLAGARSWPFPRGLAPEQHAETARLGKELFGIQVRRPSTHPNGCTSDRRRFGTHLRKAQIYLWPQGNR